jgi:23S rRNA (cytosine1962-C5)-methyltransferase
VINPSESSPIKLQLARNLVKTIKRGHAWVYAEALRQLPTAPQGSLADLYDTRGDRLVSRGFYDPDSPIAFRVCSTDPDELLDRFWAERSMDKALALRESMNFFEQGTNGFRLFNGEGDQLPGLVCDIYADVAVLSTDGPGPDRFWDTHSIAGWLNDRMGIQTVLLKRRDDRERTTTLISGSLEIEPVGFQENGISFTADLLEGQKTGFYLDQRDNRALIRKIAKDKSVLNVFGYTGGFSVAAGLGGAKSVTTVDQASPALAAAEMHWEMNGLNPSHHTIEAVDAFEFLKTAENRENKWDLVILDPPSFAPSQASLPQAKKAYTRLIELGARVTKPEGLLAPASCSSHVDRALFLEIIEQSISQARRKATILGIYGQPVDHPAPLVMPELRYLKFVLLSLD